MLFEAITDIVHTRKDRKRISLCPPNRSTLFCGGCWATKKATKKDQMQRERAKPKILVQTKSDFLSELS